MPTKFQWNDTEFQVETRLSVKRLFWGTDTTLKTAGEGILRASGSGFSSNDEGIFSDSSNQDRHFHLNVYSRAFSMRYSLRVDGIEVSAGESIPENWLIGYVAIGAQFFLAGCLVNAAL